MPPPSAYYTPNPLAAAKPTRTLFDPWNSSSTGHQRAENRLSGSTSWRDSRSLKLGEQFKDGQSGGKRISDTVGAGSDGFGKDGRLENGGWAKGASGLRKGGQRSLFECFGEGSKVDKAGVSIAALDGKVEELKVEELDGEPTSGQRERDDSDEVVPSTSSTETPTTPSSKEPQIFRNLTIYINGSTYPTISDHKLKRLLSTHGANLSIALGRRSVTHVILGMPNASGSGGAGGGLASSKIQKEIKNMKGKGIKFVSVEWVVESVKAGKRLPEARFEAMRLAMKGQGSVWGSLERKSKDTTGKERTER